MAVKFSTAVAVLAQDTSAWDNCKKSLCAKLILFLGEKDVALKSTSACLFPTGRQLRLVLPVCVERFLFPSVGRSTANLMTAATNKITIIPILIKERRAECVGYVRVSFVFLLLYSFVLGGFCFGPIGNWHLVIQGVYPKVSSSPA